MTQDAEGRAPRSNGAALRQVLQRWQGADALDEDFADRVAEVRASVQAARDRSSWQQ